MRISHLVLAARQATLPTEAVKVDPPIAPSRASTSDVGTTVTTRTTTLPKPSPTQTPGTIANDGGSNSDTILAQAEATTNLSWWQLLCIGLGGALILAVLAWAWWRSRKRSADNKKRAKEVEADEERRVKELTEARNATDRQSASDFDSDSDSEESYDSFSDGGTIVPRRRKKARHSSRRRQGDRRRDVRRRRRPVESETESESSTDYTSESSYMSAETYYPRSRARRRDKRDKRDNQNHQHRDRHRDYRERGRLPHRGRRHDQDRGHSLSPPPPMPRPQESRNRVDASFRDSVFSSYKSMKKAAVQLKYVEAKAKLTKQLAAEERVEAQRQAKIREANREIEMSKRAESAGSDRPLIPTARPRTQSSSGSSSGRLPTPPPRSARRGYSNGSTTSDHIPPVPTKHQPRRPPPSRQGTGLTAEIGNLLGNKAQPYHTTAPTEPLQSVNVQTAWLARPVPTASLDRTARSGSVYLPITKPKDRPMIPPGGLAPAPPPKARLNESPMISSRGSTSGKAGIGTNGGKWADRLRSRR